MIHKLAVILSLALWVPGARANDPGGGAAGVGANVTLTTTATTATLDNGVIQAVIDKATGKVTSYKLNGFQMVDPANPIYYSMDGGASYEQPSNCVYSVTSQSTDMVDLSFKRTWNSTSGYKHVFDIELHYVLRRGDTGLYAYAILDHPASYPAATVGEWRIVWKLPRSSTTFTFERSYIDDLRHWEMPSYYDYQNASPTAIGEIVKLNTGVMAGKYDGKYTYSARYSEIGTWGHASNISKKGVWFALGGHDYFNDGPTHQDLTSSESYILMHFGRNHYGGSGTSVAAGETWRKMYGPFLLYCNQTSATTNAGDALWADAKAQVTAEKSAWPYSWLVNPDHPAAPDRGTVTGRLLINDPLKPAITGANAMVGLAAPEDIHGNWQKQSKGYQYWTKADASGNFTIPAVRPGSYTLYAYTTGVVQEFSKTNITITAGGTNAQGDIIWNIAHPGTSIAWEIGVPDRTAKEFRHGNDYFTPYLWDVYPQELPNPLVFDVGTSNPATDWNYVHSNYPGATAGTTTGWNWDVNFNLPAVPRTGNAVLTVAVASSNYARLFLYLNGETTSFTRISPTVDGGNALLRQGIHAKYSYVDIPIPVARLRQGSNTFRFSFTGESGFSSHVMYDYLRLELPDFPSPPPDSGRSIVWAGGTNAAANTWDVGVTPSFKHSGSATAFGTGDAVTFDDTGSNTTSITLAGSLEANAVTFTGVKNRTLAGTGSLAGPMSLNKSGASTLTISQANSYSGNTVISGGTVSLAETANVGGLGTGDVTLNGGVLKMASNVNSYNDAPWNLDVPGGTIGTLEVDARCDLKGKLTGSGTFRYRLPSGAIRSSIIGDWSSFSGIIEATAISGSAEFRMSRDYNWPGLPSAALSLGSGVTAHYTANLNSGLGTFVSFGELSGNATSTLRGGDTSGRQITYRIGGLGTDATFAGSISEQTNGFTNLVKTGSGTWTLTGTGTINGTSTVENGTLRINGALTLGAAAIVEVTAGSTLEVTGNITAATVHIAESGKYIGPGSLTGSLVNDGQTLCSSGTLTVTGSVTNNGLLRLTGGAAIAVTGPFVNNGVLDLIDGSQTLPAGFVNNGIVLTVRAQMPLVWTGSASSTWDTLQSANWLNGSAADVFRAGDSVTFNDSSAVTNIELVGTLLPAAVTINTANTFTFGGTGEISGSASLTKSGPGLLTISSPQPFSGPVSITGGTLQLGLTAAFPGSPGFTVASGATLDVSGVTGGFALASGQTIAGAGTVVGPLAAFGTLSPGSSAGTLNITENLTLAATTPLDFELGATSDRVAVTGNLTLGGRLSVTAAAGFAAGTYTLFTYTGNLNTVSGGLTFASMPAGFDYALSTATSGEVNLVVAPILTLFQKWQIAWFADPAAPEAAAAADPDGDGQTNDDEFIAGTDPHSAASVTLLAWRGDGSANLWDSSTSPTFWNGARLCAFTNGNPVAFDASGAANPGVNLSGSLTPVSVSVNNTAAITFAGSGSLSGGGSLTKSGNGTLTINTANTFSGGTTISGGTLAIGSATALGTGTVTLSGGTLATGTRNPANAIQVAADSSITGGDSGGYHGVKTISGSGTLNLIATNAFDLEGTLSGFTGSVILSGTGSFRFVSGGGSASASFDLGTRSLSARNSGTYHLGSLTGQPSSSLSSSSATATFSIGGNGASTGFPGGIANGSGTTSIIKTGAGTLTLSGTGTHTGSTTVSEGSLKVTGSLGNTALTVNSNATLDSSGSLTIASLTLQPSSSTILAAGPASQPVRVAGNVTLGGNIQVNLASGTTFGRFPLITHGGIRTGTFSLTGIPAGIPNHLSYQANEVVLFLDDSDEDGLPDLWEQGQLDGLAETADGDPDGDGTSNLAEQRLGLDPANGTSSFRAVCSGRTLEWPSAPGIVFTVKRNLSLDPAGWQVIGTVTGGAEPTATFTDPDSFGRAFYRIEFIP